MYVYKNTKSTFTGWTIPENCIEISNEDYAKLVNDELVWENDALVPNPNYANILAEKQIIEQTQNKLNQIADLKSQLAATDYQAIKFAEGWISAEDYAPIKASRQALREQINALEIEYSKEENV